jgi:outer membrane protein OmpA-like peptidoglycan-associated protein
MRKHIFLLVLLASLAACAAAQQGDGSNSSSTAAGQSASDRPPIAAPTSNDYWDGDDPNFVNLIMHPFANKKYVQRLTGPIRDRVNELVQLTSETGSTIREVDSRAQQGLQLASDKTNLADQHAGDAGNKAQLAQTAATQASTRVANTEQMVANLDQYNGTAQTEIRFRPGQSILSKDAKEALDQVAAPLKDQQSYIIEIRGFSARSGPAATVTSRKMADSVVRYLVLTHQIPVYRIYTMSMGNAAVSKHMSGGRVEVSVLKNDVASAAQR